jgi:hypothetical protein
MASIERIPQGGAYDLIPHISLQYLEVIVLYPNIDYLGQEK